MTIFEHIVYCPVHVVCILQYENHHSHVFIYIQIN